MKEIVMRRPDVCTPGVGFMHFYMSGPPISGECYADLAYARTRRMDGMHGVTIKVSRGADGNFTIEKVEEF